MFDDASLLETAGRLLVVFFFLTAGFCNLTEARIKDHIERMAALHTPLPAAAFWIGIVLQFTGCALLLTGWHADIGVYCLIVFTVAASVTFHRFWIMQDPARRNTSRVMLLNNIGLLGGLLLLLENVR
jgi:putative oxidoreductase